MSPSPSLFLEVGYAASSDADARLAGASATRQALANGLTHPLSAVLVFASAQYHLPELLEGVRSVLGCSTPIMGGTTSGEICNGIHHGSVVVAALASPCIKVNCAVGSNVSKDWRKAVDEALDHSTMAPYFGQGANAHWDTLRRQGTSLFALVLVSEEMGQSEPRGYEIFEELKTRSEGRIPICGGCVSDGGAGGTKAVITEGEAHGDSLLVAVFETPTRVGMGVSHGYTPTLPRMTATRTRGHEILEIDGRPADAVFAEMLGESVAEFRGSDLRDPTGIVVDVITTNAAYSITLPSSLTESHGVRLAQPIEEGSSISLMRVNPANVASSGSQAALRALASGQIGEPALILAFVNATRQEVLGEQMDADVSGLSRWAQGVPTVGFLSSGEAGVCDDGVNRFSSGIVSALVLGADLSLAAEMWHENQRLLEEQEREIAERRQEELRRETMIANLRMVLDATDSLLVCPDEDSVCREAVEMARTKLGLDRCSIFLLQGEEMRGTYGTSILGQTTCEHDIKIRVNVSAWIAYHTQNCSEGARWKVLDQEEHVEWHENKRYVVGAGWTVSTPIWPKSADRPLGVMYNDSAITHASVEPLKQEILAVFCATLGSIIECKRQDRQIRSQAMMLDQIQDVVIATDMEGRITFVNRAACEILGKRADEIAGTHVEDYGEDPGRGATQKEIIEKTRSEGYWRGAVANFGANGRNIVLDCRTQLVRDPDGEPLGMIGVSTDITARDHQERTTIARLRLLDCAGSHTVGELLRMFLDEVEELTASEAAFFHFVEPDEETLSLQAWSTNTLATFGMARNDKRSCPIDPGDSWMNCVRERGPVVCNDCTTSPSRHAGGEAQTPIVRELVVPIIRTGNVVAVLGVGNKKTDYLDVDVRTVSQLADLAWETIVRKRTEEERSRLALAIEQADEIVVITDADATITYVNPAFEAVTGYTREETIGQSLRILKSGEQDEVFYQELWKTLTAGETWRGRLVNQRKDGSLYTEEAVISPVRNHAGGTINYVSVKRDITRELEREEQLRQQQRMEAVGRLAGGVAHDFNNLLMGIMNYVDLCRDELEPGHRVRNWLNEVRSDAKRSAEIVRQLLGFARKQPIMPQVLDLSRTISDMVSMLQRLVRENIHFTWIPAIEPCMVNMDPGQVDQIVANLVVNARDAIDGSGTITIETACVSADAIDSSENTIADVETYVLLAVSDDGTGMDSATIEHIFEPFFTTKPTGEGTGLGLANVYGIVKQNGGSVRASSESGKGTRIEVYLPRLEPVEETPQTEPPPEAQNRTEGQEVLLLVEDERSIRRTLQFSLEKLGYTVLAAESAEAALTLAAGHTGEIDLMISDVVLPGLSGPNLGQRLRERFPELICLFMSGHAPDAVVLQGLLDTETPFLQKPVPTRILTDKIRELLDNGLKTNARTNPRAGG